ncbi:MAG: GMC family oxidoreductase [Sandaracinaceae bacterium]|nr:GMC family oxidoreductase [Sandaracinaceae bacterium]
MRGTHVSFRSAVEPAFEAEADVVVVGSGAGGGAFASYLARQGLVVGVVEAGPWIEPEQYPHSVYGAMRDLMDDWGMQVTLGRAFWPIVQARVVGGTTVINSAICVRTPADVFDRWEREFGIGRGSGRGRLAERVWMHQEALEKELSAEEVPLEALGRSNALAMKGARALGYESHYMTRYVERCAGSGQCLQGCRKRRKRSVNVVWIPEIIERGGFIVSCAPVESVTFEGRRAVGVRGRFLHPKTRERGSSFQIRAKRAVVLAASPTKTPLILWQSGLRHPAIGRFFRAHPGTGVFGVYEHEVDHNIGATQGWSTLAFRDRLGIKLETLHIPLELVASRLAGGGRTLMERLARYRFFAMWCHSIRAESVGRIHRTFFGKGIVRYTLNKEDMRRLREGVYLVARTHFAAGAQSVIPGIGGMPFEIGPHEVERIREASLDPRAYVAILSHLFGGAVMGADPRSSVTDEGGRVRDCDGLLVVDASVIPSVLGVNPQHTIMALARCFAEELLGG